jgi:hypothetical protein
MGPGLTTAALVALVFAAPLTLYSAMFWEHTPAVLLAWLGLAAAIEPPSRSSWPHVAAGGALGLSAWLRPEHLLLAALACGWLCVLRPGPWTWRGRAGFLAGAGLAVGAFLAWNWATSGSPLGLHGLQVTSGEYFDPRRGPAVLRQYIALTTRYFPLGALAAATAAACLALPAGRRFLSATDLFLLALPASFVVILSFLFATDGGKQWGPRYLLILVPMLTLLAARLLAAMWDGASGWARVPRGIVTALFAAALAAGAWINAVGGARDLADDYAHRILPALRVIRRAPARVVVTDNMFVVMELTATFADKRWFTIHAGRPEELAFLAAAMHAAGEARLLAVVGRAERLVPELRIGGATPLRLRLQGPRTAGALNVYEGELSDVP